MRRLNNQKGFSLIELIVVIAIMAVLVGVIAPQFLGYVERSKIAVDQANVNMLNSVTQVYYVNNTESNPFEDETKSNAKLIKALLDSGELTSTFKLQSEDTAFGWSFPDKKWYLNGPTNLDRINPNDSKYVTIDEAKAAGYTMPIYDTFWLYKYMNDRNNNGMVGE